MQLDLNDTCKTASEPEALWMRHLMSIPGKPKYNVQCFQFCQ